MSTEKIIRYPQRRMSWPGRLLGLVHTPKGRVGFFGLLIGLQVCAVIWGNVVWQLVVCAAFCGFLFGGLAGWEQGMRDKEKILDDTIGERWFEDAWLRKIEREKKATAPWN